MTNEISGAASPRPASDEAQALARVEAKLRKLAAQLEEMAARREDADYMTGWAQGGIKGALAEIEAHRETSEPAHMCICGHHAAEHSNIESGECLADGCGCVMLAEVEPVSLPVLPWVLDADGSHWRAEMPDGRTGVIQRVLGGGGEASLLFVPAVYESAGNNVTGPECGSVLAAAAWCAAAGQ